MQVLRTPRNRPLVRFALYSGKRLGKLIGLKWSDVDLKNGLVTFRGFKTKSGRTSTVPVNKTCMEVLRRAKELKIRDYVFPNTKGNYYRNFTHVW